MLKQFPKDVKLVFKNFPLRSHTFAMKAAQAGLAADKQGKFWQMHDKIFEQHNKLTDEKITGFAKELGLNAEQFAKDMDSFEVKKQIQLDLQGGSQAGVRGTPTIFVNGRRLKNRSLDGFVRTINLELQRLQTGK